jgi:Inner membrane component of T3SS, cytoplasmic domain
MAVGFRLIVTRGKSEGKTISFAKSMVRVGRSQDNDLVLYDLNVSRHHFDIVWRDTGYFLQDGGSQNGTKVNGEPAVEVALQDGDRIQLGALELEFLGSDTQPKITMDDNTERGEVDAPVNGEQRTTLEELRTSAMTLEQLKAMKDGKPKLPPTSLHKKANRAADTRKLKAAVRQAKSEVWRRVRYPALAATALLVIVAVVVTQYRSKTIDLSEKRFVLSANLDNKSYGAGRVDVATPHKAHFVWLSNGGRSIVTYTAGGIDREGEVSIELNGEDIGNVATTGPPWGNVITLKLDRKKLRKNEENSLVFRHHPVPGEAPRWAVRDMSLSETLVPVASLEGGFAALKLADVALENRRITPGNLAAAADHYRRAVMLLEDVEPRPPEYEVAERKMASVEKELDRIVNDALFSAEQARKLGKNERALLLLREAMAYVPRSDDPRHKSLEERLQALSPK